MKTPRTGRSYIVFCRGVLVIWLVLGTGGAGQGPAGLSEATFAGLTARAIGPATFAGRITDFAVFESDPATFYAGTPHGGLWKTVNHGTTWEVLFADQPDVVSIGAVAIAPHDPNLVWVGTGEAEGVDCASWGNGIYKSTDGGHTWQHRGLIDTKHIARIVIDPVDHEVVYVAASGHMWGPNKERGVFKSTDGGNTWSHVLSIDEETGATDLLMDPSNNKLLYAATHQVRRGVAVTSDDQPSVRGPGSGIYKSTDAGATWTKLTVGLPAGPLGRIGLDVYRKNPNVVYAIIEDEKGRDIYRSDDKGASWRKMNASGPSYMGHTQRFFSQIRVDPNDDHRIYVCGVNMYWSDDGGKTFVTNANALQSGFWPAATWGYLYNTRSDHRTLWVDPGNSRHLLSGTDGGVFVSWDRGQTWEMIDNMDLGEHYRVGYDMDTPYRVYGGMQDNRSWGGPSSVRSYLGIGNGDWFMVGGADGFQAWGDPYDSRIVYAESQFGNMDRVDRLTNERKGIKPEAEGDEVLRWNSDTPIVISPHDPGTIFTAANRVFKSTDRGHSWTTISPDLTGRVDLKTPSLTEVSRKIFKGGIAAADPDVLVAFAESPKKAGLYYAGADDGTVHVSKDGGQTWTNLTDRFPGLPKHTSVARLVPSAFDEGAVYAAFDGHRNDDYNTYVYASRDFGQSWKSIASDIPKGFTVRSMLEDRKSVNVLYLGTEFGLFVSLDKGLRWTRLKCNLPTAPIFDMAQHPRENDLILAVHGRSLWILDDLTPIQETAEALAADAFLFELRPATEFNPANDREWMAGDRHFWGKNPPFGAIISYYLRQPPKELGVRMRDVSGMLVREIAGNELKDARQTGINRIQWNLRYQPLPVPRTQPSAEEGLRFFPLNPPRAHVFQEIRREELDSLNGPFVLPGQYTITLVVNGREVETKPVKVVGDPLIPISDADRTALHDATLALHEWQRTTYQAGAAVAALHEQLDLVQATLKTVTNPPTTVKTAAEELAQRMTALRRQVEPPAGELGGGGGGATDDLPGKIGALKTRIWGSTSRPTEVQMRRVGEMRTAVARLVDEVNRVITTEMPALYQILTTHDIHPAPLTPLKPIRAITNP